MSEEKINGGMKDIFDNAISCVECGAPLNRDNGTTRPSDGKPVCGMLCMTTSESRSKPKEQNERQ